MSEAITPTVGRIVWFFAAHTTTPWPALIVAVHPGDVLVDVCYFTPGGCFPRTSVELVQPGEESPMERPWCEWMPYQVKKTTGSESGEPAVGTESI